MIRFGSPAWPPGVAQAALILMSCLLPHTARASWFMQQSWVEGRGGAGTSSCDLAPAVTLTMRSCSQPSPRLLLQLLSAPRNALQFLEIPHTGLVLGRDARHNGGSRGTSQCFGRSPSGRMRGAVGSAPSPPFHCASASSLVFPVSTKFRQTISFSGGRERRGCRRLSA